MASSDIYTKRQWWKVLLVIMGLIIVFITIFYSNYLASQLAKNEENKVKLMVELIKSTLKADTNTNLNADQAFALSYMESTNNIPFILEDEQGGLDGNNYPESKINDQEFLKSRKELFLKSGKEPIVGIGYASKVYYENSRLYKLITYFPIVQGLLLIAFIGLGYFFFSASRKGEQNRVWAGMAKETAHQLGTPISAIMAWIDLLKEMNVGKEDQLEIISELSNDVDRLELIADRFSKIGSTPKLVPVNIYSELDVCMKYMERRASKKVSFQYPAADTKALNVNINKHLFDWVIENLIRNSLDAMGAVGTVTAEVKEEGNYIVIDMSDTGKGIPSNKQRTVFEPGFTTKKRGWGLGLSLAKRIIEDYHSGKIFVKNSKINEGTTFSIRMPKA